jgi:YidC/Oxa1 family membrane protein insertase
VERRIVLFLTLSIAVLVGNYFVQAWLRGPQQLAADKQAAEKQVADKAKADARKKQGDNSKENAKQAEAKREAAENEVAAPAPAVEDELEEKYFSLGSADSTKPFRMVATLTSRGAALERVELNGPRFMALEVRSGYMGYLAPIDGKGGALVRVVGASTPADLAGIQPGDVITKLDDRQITGASELLDALAGTRPRQTVKVTVRRGEEQRQFDVTLARTPAQVIRPEQDTIPLDIVKPGAHDPLSVLLTLDEVDERRVLPSAEELADVRLRGVNWKGDKLNDHTIQFERIVAKYNLKVIKRYQLAQSDPSIEGPQADHHLTITIELQNLDQDKPRDLAYRLDGPTGLPTEGWWFLNRISTSWSGVGTRDVALRFEDNPATLISSLKIAEGTVDEEKRPETDKAPLVYAGVDSQYFAAVLLPQRAAPNDVWFSEIKPLRVGEVPKDVPRRKLTNVTCRLVSTKLHLEPGESAKHEFQLFVGPKQPALLAQYGTDNTTLEQLVYFGWSIWGVVAAFLTKVLHFFYGIVGNYGIAIIMLTVLVRLCMFPLSRKQALSAQKMQELQPEMKKINEKFKGNNEARARAMQELWRKHNYNPMGGCLLAFVQLPIFIGLYRALMIDVELRGAPLFSESIRWCSDLSAPDMLFHWGNWWPQYLFGETGWLGPYFNVLPLITIALFLVQQKMFMPPATDEQTAMQQKVMTWMMVFMGILFYKVASGLCLYFIASSLWGIGERKLLPKMIAKSPASSPETAAPRAPSVAAATGGNGATKTAQRKKHRGRR